MLNRRAGRQAMASTAYDAAYTLFSTALELLPPDPWTGEPELCLALHQDLTDAACASQKFEETLRYGQSVIDHTADAVAAMPAYYRMVEAMVAQHRNVEAVRLGLEGLGRLGVQLPADPTDADTGQALQATAAALQPYDVEALLDLPPMTDRRVLAVLDLATLIAIPSAFVSGGHFVSLATTLVRQTLAHGLAPSSAFGSVLYSNVLCGPLAQPALGYRFGKLAVDLLEQLDEPKLFPQVVVSFETSVRHFVDHQAHSLAPLLEGYRLGVSSATSGWPPCAR